MKHEGTKLYELEQRIINLESQLLGIKHKEPEKKTLAQDFFNIDHDGLEWKHNKHLHEYYESLADRAKEVLLEGKEGVLTTLISGCEASHHTPKEMARAILTFLKSGGE